MTAARHPAARVVRGRLIERSGEYNRLAEPDWQDPLDSSYSQAAGGRWNEPGAFPVLYLNDSVGTARLRVLHRLRRFPYGPEDLDPDQQHDLVWVRVPRREYLDCVSELGLEAVGLPRTYPRHRNGRPVTYATCRPIGGRAHDDGLPGIACRSAATGAARDNEELAFFDVAGQPRLTLVDREPFADWWWAGV